ncbi:MAG TPA: aldehyde dehydrogenase (NADP(+)) [Acidobacteriaceae bacterium]|nr:aldehyde dehydrogenase (NADP(+)) [Acidobacteriaceae bacterium]
MDFRGVSLIAGREAAPTGQGFRAISPAAGAAVDPPFFSATEEDVDRAVFAAHNAFLVWRKTPARARARLLRAIADGLDAAMPELVARAQLETALPEARLQGETKRTSGQWRLFADVIEEGSWVAARIDTALPDRKPAPRPDIRSMLQPLGPVAVFGASNFPLAYSVAGGDSASALAAGNSIVVKAHPAHPGTSELVARILAEGIRSCGAPEGLFSLLYDQGFAVGEALVRHPLICAVGFTGSRNGGRALMDLAAQRPEPIPCFAEMGSTNPVIILPGALRRQGNQIASGLFSSFTLGAGQFCTKPGMVFVPDQQETMPLLAELRRLTAESATFTLLTPGIAANYTRSLQARSEESGLNIQEAKPSAGSCTVAAALLETEINAFLNHPEWSQEVFGPTSLLIRYQQRDAILRAAEELEGHLTASVWSTEADLADYADLVAILERKAGRLIFNGFPTGLEVSDAIVHGGPYPACSDSRFTAVGSRAILRFARPVCYQGFPEASLPDDLRNANPLGILRMINGNSTRDPVSA